MRTLPTARRPRRIRRESGFTLVEVTLALGILAFGLLWALVARNRALEVATTTRNVKIARMLASSMLAEIESGLRDDVRDGMMGDFSDRSQPEFEWTVAIGEDSVAALSDFPTDESLAGFYQRKAEDRARAEESGEDLPEAPRTPVAVRVRFKTPAEDGGAFVLEAAVETATLKGEFATSAASGETGAGEPGGPSPAGGGVVVPK